MMNPPHTLSRLAPSALLLAGLFLTGCNNVGTSLLILGVAAPENPTECTFASDSEVYRGVTVLNTDPQPLTPNNIPQRHLRLVARYENLMIDEPRTVSSAPQDQFTQPTDVKPLRFDFRWECESNGFTNIDSFLMPYFRPRSPFCVNERVDSGDAVGFDSVAATGQTTAAGEEPGLISFTPVPVQLGEAFDTAYRLGGLANSCCDEFGGDCTRLDALSENDALPGACEELQATFDVMGGDYSARVSSDVRAWQAYAIYNGAPRIEALGAAFPMRIVGQFEFVTGSGRTVVSSDLAHIIETCRGCGLPTSSCTL